MAKNWRGCVEKFLSHNTGHQQTKGSTSCNIQGSWLNDVVVATLSLGEASKSVEAWICQ